MLQPNQPHSQEGKAAYTAKTMQRQGVAKVGSYVCQSCQKKFEYKSIDEELECPRCHTKIAENLTPYYTEEDPKADEMLGRDHFAAGD